MTHAGTTETDHTELKHVLTSAVKVGVMVSLLVFAFSQVARWFDGTVELILHATIIVVGIWVTAILPGVWTRPRSIEGIAGAAGIGLGGTVVYMLIDVAALQPLGTYTNRWLEIGGGSNWWYHPVWWMAGTFLAWMGAFALANQARKGEPSPVGVLITALILAAFVGGGAAVLGVPGATLGLGTIAVALLPAIALTALLTGLGARRA